MIVNYKTRQLMNLTSDNVSVNDSSLRFFSTFLDEKEKIEFDHKDQCSQYHNSSLGIIISIILIYLTSTVVFRMPLR